jgi:hypothetical protein
VFLKCRIAFIAPNQWKKDSWYKTDGVPAANDGVIDKKAACETLTEYEKVGLIFYDNRHRLLMATLKNLPGAGQDVLLNKIYYGAEENR